MKHLEDIWVDLIPGDIILYKKKIGDKKDKIKLVILTGVDVWDMAMVIYFTDYKDFYPKHYDDTTTQPETHHLFEWGDTQINILGHWNTMPSFLELLNAYRNGNTK